MGHKKYLNEETYQKGKKGLTSFGLIIMLAGILIGGLLIFNGINTMKNNDHKKQENELLKEQKLMILNQELNLLKQEIETLESSLSKANMEKQQIFSEDKGFSDRYYQKQEEIDQLSNKKLEKTKEKTDKELEMWRIESDFGNLTPTYSMSTGLFSILPGIFVIIASLMIGGSIIMTANGRHILAWQVQSVLPVAEEAVEKVTPTIKKVGEELSPLYGTIAKEVTKGIKEGLKDEDK